MYAKVKGSSPSETYLSPKVKHQFNHADMSEISEVILVPVHAMVGDF